MTGAGSPLTLIPMNIAFISNLAGPDMVLILIVVTLLFGAMALDQLTHH